jgi:dihydroorotate dehydrogenase (fumarate)
MLATTICQGKLSLPTCIFNASGPRTGSSDALAKISKSRAGAVLAKSATLKEQDGNPLPRTWQSDGIASMNSEGLPNKGIG